MILQIYKHKHKIKGKVEKKGKSQVKKKIKEKRRGGITFIKQNYYKCFYESDLDFQVNSLYFKCYFYKN